MATLAAAVLAMTAVAADPNDAVRVMSFNVRYDNPADGPNAWPRRRDWVAEIVATDADVVGMQEVLKRQLDDLRTRLPEFEFHAAGRDDGRQAGESVPVAWRKERFEAVETGAFWLSPTPDVPGSKGWDANLPRVTTWARLRDKRTGVTFLFVATHFDHRGAEARKESAALLRTRLAALAKGDPVLLVGDFNATPSSAPIMTLIGPGAGTTFRDLRTAVTKPEGPASTWNGFEKVADEERIDFAFAAGPVEVSRFRTLDATRDGRFPSDHLPIVAVVTLGKQ